MSALLPAFPLLVLAVWTAVAGAYALLFFGRGAWPQRLATPLLWSGFALHLAYLVTLTLEWRQFPATTVSQALSVMAFAIAAIYLLLEHLVRERSTGFWLLAQVWAFQLLAVILGPAEAVRREPFGHPLFALHVALALLGYAAFAVAASYGFLFLRLYRELKGSRFPIFYGRLPALQVLDRMMTGALVVGFVALTLALLDGAVWIQQLGRNDVAWHDPTVLVSLVTWGLYGAALLLRRLHRWQGRQTAIACLAGLGVIVVSLLGVHLLAAGFHRAF
jgi:ABC-type uncharacterized transport system permease subunit